MAVVNVRIDDDTHEDLKRRAAASGVTLSEYIRNLISEEVVSLRDSSLGDLEAPESISVVNRRLLANSFRALANSEEGEYERQGYLDAVKVFEDGLTGEYGTALGLYGELSMRDCERVSDILEMFRIVTFSLKELEESGATVPEELIRDLRYRGFDFNDTLESRMAGYVEYIMREPGIYAELQPQLKATDGGNSHMQQLEIYLRMLNELRRIRESRKNERNFFDSWKLSLDDLQRIANAKIHPENRHRYPEIDF